MIPDGLHHRNNDWTLFILNRHAGETPADNQKNKKRRKTLRLATLNRRDSLRQTLSQQAIKVVRNENPTQIRTMKEFRCFAFWCQDLSQGWKLFGKHRSKTVFNLDDFSISVLETKTNTPHIKYTYTESHQYTILNPRFHVIFTGHDEKAIGFKFATELQATSFQNQFFYMEAKWKDTNENGAEKQNADTPETTTTTNNSNSNVNPNPDDVASTKKPHALEKLAPNLTGTKGSPLASSSISTTENTKLLYCVNYVRNKLDPTVKRGSVVFSMCFCTPYPFFHIFKPIMVIALDEYYKNPSKDIIKTVFENINKMTIPRLPKTPWYHNTVYRDIFTDNREYHTVYEFKGKTTIPIKIPLYCHRQEYLGNQSLTKLLNIFGPSVMNIYNAILSQHRILFVADPRHQDSDSVVHCILACISMVAPILDIVRRCFPYTYLGAMDFVTVPGYIAGVSNPVFKNSKDWDVLCDLEAKSVTMNPKIILELDSPIDPDGSGGQSKDYFGFPWDNFDKKFFASIQNKIKNRAGELKIRQEFINYTRRFVEMATGKIIANDEKSNAELAANVGRISMWKKSDSYFRYTTVQKQKQRIAPIGHPTLDIQTYEFHHFQGTIGGSRSRLISYLNDLNVIGTANPESTMQLLSWFPSRLDGLYHLAIQFLHSDTQIQRLTLQLFTSLEKYSPGRIMISKLNPFLLMAYHRVKDREQQLNSSTKSSSLSSIKSNRNSSTTLSKSK